MRARIKIDMSNAAFGDMPGTELARILRELATYIIEDDMGPMEPGVVALRDINGNTVGTFKVTR